MKHLQPSNPLEKKGQDSDRLTTAEELLRTGTDAGKAALAAHRAGLSVIPPKPNGKAPILATWKEFQERRATLEELATWYADGLNGIGVVCGRVSGNLMALDFDDIQAYHDLKELTKTAGLEELVARIEAGYLESTPRGGRHWLWRCSQVRGNEKLASRPTRQDDSFTGHKTLIETRGEGGYVVVSPSTGSIDGRPATYERLSGLFRTIVEISPEDQETLLRLSRTLDEVGPSPTKSRRLHTMQVLSARGTNSTARQRPEISSVSTVGPTCTPEMALTTGAARERQRACLRQRTTMAIMRPGSSPPARGSRRINT